MDRNAKHRAHPQECARSKTEGEKMQRCRWCNERNPAYVAYHDAEWGVQRFDDAYLFEMLLLESFQAGLSWECILNKREHFRAAFDGFDPVAIRQYDEEKVTELLQNPGIVRNRRKIGAAIGNAAVFLELVAAYGSFYNYLRTMWDGNVCVESDRTHSPLSDRISKDLQKRGMRFVGTTIVYAYLQAIGVVNSHEPQCFLHPDTAQAERSVTTPINPPTTAR